MHSLICFTMLMIGVTGGAVAGGAEMIRLPPPQTDGGMPLMQAFKARHSTREFSARALPLRFCRIS